MSPRSTGAMRRMCVGRLATAVVLCVGRRRHRYTLLPPEHLMLLDRRTGPLSVLRRQGGLSVSELAWSPTYRDPAVKRRRIKALA
jgi:hypothetical protein